MKYKRFDDTIVLRLEAGEDINGSLMSLAQKEKITLASVSGIGATDDFTVGVFDIESKDYNKKHYTGNHEITSLTGNITEMNGAPYVHLHITCAGKDGKPKSHDRREGVYLLFNAFYAVYSAKNSFLLYLYVKKT